MRRRWFAAVLVPALALYFLYHRVLELAMRGSTPGKRLAGVRVVTRDGGAPSAGALLVRNVFRLIDSLPLAYGLGLIAGGADPRARALRRHGGRDAAGLREPRALAFALTPATTAGALDVATAELIAELLTRWPHLSAPARASWRGPLLARCGRSAAELAPLEDAALRQALIEATRVQRVAT